MGSHGHAISSVFDLEKCYLHQNGVEFEEELNGMPMDEILSLWPRFSFDSYIILEFQAMPTCWPNVNVSIQYQIYIWQ